MYSTRAFDCFFQNTSEDFVFRVFYSYQLSMCRRRRRLYFREVTASMVYCCYRYTISVNRIFTVYWFKFPDELDILWLLWLGDSGRQKADEIMFSLLFKNNKHSMPRL